MASMPCLELVYYQYLLHSPKGVDKLNTSLHSINHGLVYRDTPKEMHGHRPRIKTYPDIGHKAFGYEGRAIVSMFMYLELYLVAVEFLFLEGDNLNKLFPSTAFKLFGLKIGGKQAFGFQLMFQLVEFWLQLCWFVCFGGWWS